jgi:alanine dehydrogenase
MILKVGPPTLAEIAMMNNQTNPYLIDSIKTMKKSYFEALSKKKDTALAFEYIKMKTAATPLYDPLNSRNRLDINCG